MSDKELSPDRPWERDAAAQAAAAAAKPREYKPGLPIWVWVLIVLAGIALVGFLYPSFSEVDGVEGGTTQHDREVASLQYAVKSAACDSAGGIVPN